MTKGPTFDTSIFLLKLFTVDGFRHFLLEHYHELLKELPENLAPQSFFDHVAHEFHRRGWLDWVFCQNLIAVRPERRLEIYEHFRASVDPDILTEDPAATLTQERPKIFDFKFRGSLKDMPAGLLAIAMEIARNRSLDDALVIFSFRVETGTVQVRSNLDGASEPFRGLSRPGVVSIIQEEILNQTGLVLLAITDPKAAFLILEERVSGQGGAFVELILDLFRGGDIGSFLTNDRYLSEVTKSMDLRGGGRGTALRLFGALRSHKLLVYALRKIAEQGPRHRSRVDVLLTGGAK